MLQTANTAQSIYNIAEQASLFIPLTTTPRSLPSYATIDTASRWHSSALQAMAIESITLPTRLRATQNGSTTFTDIEGILSNDGNRRIAALSLSFDESTRHTSPPGNEQVHNGNANGHTPLQAYDEQDDLTLDIDMHPWTKPSDRSGGHERLRLHVFGQMQSLRGQWKSSLEVEDINSISHNRFSQGPRLQRSVRRSCRSNKLSVLRRTAINLHYYFRFSIAFRAFSHSPMQRKRRLLYRRPCLHLLP